ncbi:MAG: winged helix-turn-helix domain-containing protein [Candidatus Bathyarchaeia archaeon]|jgi:predicted transcriptional regulator
MTNKRSKLEIYVDIMDEINKGTTQPTKIMYAANLAWIPVQRMLKSLVNQELIEEYDADEHDQRSNKLYCMTEKGQSVLLYFDKVRGILEKKKPVEIMGWR